MINGRRGTHLLRRGTLRTATRHATSLLRHRATRTPQRQWRGIRAHGSDGRGNLREDREDPAPTVGICWDAIAPNRVDQPGISAGGTQTATTIGKGGMPKRGVINAQCYECATRHAFIMTRHATSLQRQMRPTPPLSPYAHWSQNRLASRMDTSLRAIPHSKGIRWATFAVRNGEFTTPTNKRDAARHVATKADEPVPPPITLCALQTNTHQHGNQLPACSPQKRGYRYG